MLIRRGPSHIKGYSLKTDFKHKDCISGWTVICPTGFVLDFWKSLVFAGGRAIGLNEQSMLCFESGLPSFPSSWPLSKAYYKHLLGDSQSAVEGILKTRFDSWTKKPKSKKENFEKKGALCPFYPPIHSLVGLDEPEVLSKYSFLKNKLTKQTLQTEKDDSSQNIECSEESAIDSNFSSQAENKPLIDIESNTETSDLKIATTNLDTSAKLSADIVTLLADQRPSPWLISSLTILEGIKKILKSNFNLDKPLSFENWIKPLVEIYEGIILTKTGPLSISPVNKAVNFNHAIVRVLLYSVKRGSAEDNAVISIPSFVHEGISNGKNSNKFNFVQSQNLNKSNLADKFPSKKEIIGYVVNGDYSYSVSKGFALGVISLKGLYKIWKQQTYIPILSTESVDLKQIDLPKNDKHKKVKKETKSDLVVDVSNVNGKLRRLYSLSLM
ncbi:Ribonucleases P/MRP protein subunit POP1 [Smittium culicis]|uniref:Ribonucleases P/MRP protein subunit POP1 n=1 Tax=Smittium culicis TaxID=133412 RepID=A0A1R1Y5S8_9FUNG|nr:Ribonucleases P/MRP protein subunit POP1 [Smittium culicis]